MAVENFYRVSNLKDIYLISVRGKKNFIAKSLCECTHLYLWDEPLNFIDFLSRVQIEELILSFRPTILFVEHDEMFIKSISTHIVNL